MIVDNPIYFGAKLASSIFELWISEGTHSTDALKVQIAGQLLIIPMNSNELSKTEDEEPLKTAIDFANVKMSRIMVFFEV